jgi:hypothetical protein
MAHLFLIMGAMMIADWVKKYKQHQRCDTKGLTRQRSQPRPVPRLHFLMIKLLSFQAGLGVGGGSSSLSR